MVLRALEKAMTTENRLIVVKQVVKEYRMGGHTVRALDGVDFELDRGLLVAIVGASGSGKTTLLNLLGAMDHPTSGEVIIAGLRLGGFNERELTAHRRSKIGFVFQAFNLIPNLTALENVMLPLEYNGVAAGERRRRALELLEQVGMAHRLGHKPARLSGGEQQRVAIARALANDPPVILADEPTGNLDSITGKQVMELLHGLAHERGKTVVVVTHDETIRARADITLHIRDGRILETL